jgi:Bacterial Ig domain/Right handed beta helix region
MIRVGRPFAVVVAVAAVVAGIVVIPPGAGSAACTTTVSSVAAAASAVDAASPGATVCMTDGTYGKLTLNAQKATPGVTVRAQNPGKATLAGASVDGSYLTVAQFRMTGTWQAEPGSQGMTADHNLFVGGNYFGVMAGPSTTTTVDDVTITNNQFVGRFNEDAIRLNRYHDGPDADSYGVLIEGNEFSGNVEDGGHNDVVQSVWVGDHLVFRRNYLHDFGGQGFFVKDQQSAIDGLVVEDNLILRQNLPCDPVSLCPGFQASPFQIFGPISNGSIRHNTVWPGPGGGASVLRASGWSSVTVSDNVFDVFGRDATVNVSASNDSRCDGAGWAGLTAIIEDCNPPFIDPANGDYRQANGRGVTWRLADQHFGPTADDTTPSPPTDPTDPPPPTDPTDPPPPTDGTAPETTISSGPDGPTNDATPTFGFDASEAGAAFACRVDDGEWANCTSPWTTAALDDGEHSVGVRASDATDNTDASPATRSFTVDTVSPHTTITSPPPATSTTDRASIAFTVDEAGSTSQCLVDANAWVDCTSAYEVSGLTQGAHTVIVRSRDAAGNVESPGASASWTVDVPSGGGDPGEPPPTTDTPPTTDLTSPAAGSVMDSGLRVAAIASDDHGVDHVDFWVDDERVRSDTRSPYGAWVNADQLPAGTHTLSVRAFDAAGQAASTAITVRAVSSDGWGRSRRWVKLSSVAKEGGVTQLTGRTAPNAVVRVDLTPCDSADGSILDTFTLRADENGRLDAAYAGAGACVLRLVPSRR